MDIFLDFHRSLIKDALILSSHCKKDNYFNKYGAEKLKKQPPAQNVLNIFFEEIPKIPEIPIKVYIFFLE